MTPNPEGKADGKGDQVVELMEITMRNLLSTGKIDLNNFLARADMLAAVGKTVLISGYFEYYRLANLRNLFRRLVDRGRIQQLGNFDETVLHIFSRDVLRRIQENDAEWENMVPPEIPEIIQRRQFFGYRGPEGQKDPIAKPAKTSG